MSPEAISRGRHNSTVSSYEPDTRYWGMRTSRLVGAVLGSKRAFGLDPSFNELIKQGQSQVRSLSQSTAYITKQVLLASRCSLRVRFAGARSNESGNHESSHADGQ